MKTLSKNQIVMLHESLIDEFGGSRGIRDEGLLESAIRAPFQTFAGQDLYPTIQAKAAQLCYGLVKNHAFVDGNKRIGVHAMLVFLELNNIILGYTQKDLFTIILDVADGRAQADDMTKWILSHC